MTKGKPCKLLMGFAGPLLVGNIFQQLYNLVDTIIVGRYVGEEALAAVGTTGTVLFFMMALAMGLSNGAGIAMAQYIGVKDHSSMRKAVAALMALVIILTIMIMTIGYWSAPSFFRLLRVPDEIIKDSILYIRICFLGIAGTTFYNAAAAILRSVGDSKTPLKSVMVSSVVNIGFNLFFVLVCHMGVAGVAYGTVIAQAFSAIICIRQIFKERISLHLDHMEWKISRKMILIIMKTGIPSALQSAMISLGAMSVQGLVNSFGASTMAAYAAVQKVDGVVIQVIVALGTAMSVFTGQNIGAKRYDRIKEALKDTLRMMLGSSIVLAALILVFKRNILTFIMGNGSVDAIEIGCQYMSIIGAAYLIASVMNSYIYLIRGAGDVNVSFMAGIAELTGRIVFAYVLVIPFGTTGIWLATPLSWACGCIIPVVRYYSGKWKNMQIASVVDEIQL